MKTTICIIFVVMSLLCSTASAITDKECVSYALYRESSGEGILTQRAVYDIIHTRAKKLKKSLCWVLHQPFQFPYFAEGVKTVPKWFLVRMEFIAKLDPVLDESFMYFNDTPLPYGKKKHLKLGGLYFS